MKSMQVLMVVFLGVAIGFMSCGYGGTGGGGSPDCRANCQKELDCCEVNPDCYMWDEEAQMAECLCECGNIHRMATFDYLQRMKQCNNVANYRWHPKVRSKARCRPTRRGKGCLK